MGSDMEPVPYTPCGWVIRCRECARGGTVMVVPNRVVTVTIPMAGVS